jgi:alkylhydroperoxidase family enzyme
MSERASTLVRRPARGGLLCGSLLAHRDRELLILRTASNCHADYEWAHHVVIGKQAGLTHEEIDASATASRMRDLTLPRSSDYSDGASRLNQR